MKYLTIIALALCSCTRPVNIDRLDDYSQVAYSPEYATGFRVMTNGRDYALEVFRPDTMRVAIPKGGYKRLLCMSTTYVGSLATLGADSTIVAVSGKKYLTTNIDAVEVGHEGAMDYEAVVAAKPELALIYGVDGASSLAAKFAELSVPYIYISDFEENNPLGRAEWTVALGALAGADGSAKFQEIKSNYRPEIEQVTKVMVNGPYSGTWFIPGAENYISRLIADAGGTLTITQPTGYQSKPVDFEKALPALESADLWLFPGQVDNLRQLKALMPKSRYVGPVWNQTADFYETGASRPDLVIEELKQIFKGTATDSLRYFRRLR